MCVSLCVCACVCVCVRERGIEREREKKKSGCVDVSKEHRKHFLSDTLGMGSSVCVRVLERESERGFSHLMQATFSHLMQARM